MQKNDLKINFFLIGWIICALIIFIWSCFSLVLTVNAQAILSQENISLSNDFLTTEVNPLNGNFNLHLPYQNNYRHLENYHQGRLLFGNPETNTSGATFIINNQPVKFTPQNSYQSNNSLISIQNTSNYQIRQILSFVESPHTLRTDLLEIKYEINNLSTHANLNIGAKITLDPQLEALDLPYFYDDQYGLNYFKSERQKFKSDLPQYWQAKNSPSEPTLVSEGLFYLDEWTEEQKPDNIIFTCRNWANNYHEATSLDSLRKKKFEHSSACDGAVLIFFKSRILNAGEKITFTTYYGLSDFSQMPTLPELSVTNINSSTSDLKLSANYGNYEPNFFEASFEVSNISQVVANNLISEIVLPDGLKLPAGRSKRMRFTRLRPDQKKIINWSIQAEPQEFDQNFSYQVLIWADKTLVQTINFNIFVPKMRYQQAIIVLPGIGGSKLFQIDQKTQEKKLLWLKLGADFSQLAMNANFLSDVNNIIADENEYLNYGLGNIYGEIIIALQNAFHKKYEVIFWPYDWRLSNSDSSSALADFIDKNKYQKVILVGHSMGGLIALDYWQNHAPEKVEKIITLATPYYGTPRAAYVLETGNFLSGFLGSIGNLFTHHLVKNLAQNLPAIYELLPSYRYFKFHQNYLTLKEQDYFNGHWSISDAVNYTSSINILKKTIWGQTKSARQFGENFHQKILDEEFLAQNSNKLFQYIGYGFGTIAQLEYTSQLNKTQLSDVISLDNGDGTVPVQSANNGKIGTTNSQTFYAHLTHQDLVKQQEVLKSLIRIINNENGLGESLSLSVPEKSFFGYIKIKVACPVDVSITDSNNKKIAEVQNGYQLIKDNQEASTFIIGEDHQTKIFFLQNPHQYQIKLQGTDVGEMTYTVEFYDKEGNLTHQQVFENVKIDAQTTIQTEVDYQNLENTLILDIQNNNSETENSDKEAGDESLNNGQHLQSNEIATATIKNINTQTSIFLKKIEKHLSKNITKIAQADADNQEKNDFLNINNQNQESYAQETTTSSKTNSKTSQTETIHKPEIVSANHNLINQKNSSSNINHDIIKIIIICGESLGFCLLIYVFIHRKKKHQKLSAYKKNKRNKN